MPRLSIIEVLDQVQARAPDLAPHLYLDGKWLWYCGPSLQGEAHKPQREALKEIGFRFAGKGHPLKDAEGKEITGHWGHSCQAPTALRRTKTQRTQRTKLSDSITTQPKTTKQQPVRYTGLEVLSALDI